ncbi:MAG: 5-(carboxyamino)imidazole ribonucleotide synthase [Planctomycetaceae bacterium]|nr:5-(carboxyamino)imidazole ribonucleotide synthase [Planctomycetaceae bacterium]
MKSRGDMTTDRSQQVFLPGSTLGMVGGGQLGRMFAMAASAMGYDVVVFCDTADDPAAQVAHRHVIGPLDDHNTIDRFAEQCDVISLEFENIPAETIARCGRFAPTYPAASVLATAQDRIREKSTFQSAGLPVTPFADVSDRDSLMDAAEKIGWPLVLKTARSGYDGKGQYKLDSAEQAQEVPWDECDHWVAEKFISFEKEVSVVVARRPSGEIQCFPVFENEHANHILDVTTLPAKISASVSETAIRVATAAAEALDVIGLLCVEFFVIGDQVMINEVAPRPHNSGHLTIEACETSQFEQHVRAICNLPLGSTAMKCPAAAMANLLGDCWGGDGQTPSWDRMLEKKGVRLHLYGKRTPKPARKMGHLTVTGFDRDQVRQTALSARESL